VPDINVAVTVFVVAPPCTAVTFPVFVKENSNGVCVTEKVATYVWGVEGTTTVCACWPPSDHDENVYELAP
jgi:hypothetical protein